MKKLIVLFLFSLSCLAIAGNLPAEKARGVFIAFGAGPRFPVGVFGNNSNVGYGLNVEISYTDNEYLPFFLFFRAGFQQYAGSQNFYKTTDYSNLSTNSIPLHLGVRYYFPPLVESAILLMPVVEVSAGYSYFQKLHEFKPNTNRVNFTEKNSKLGISAGAGVSMFLMELLVTYNYFQTNQYVGLDLRVRLPIFVSY